MTIPPQAPLFRVFPAHRISAVSIARATIARTRVTAWSTGSTAAAVRREMRKDVEVAGVAVPKGSRIMIRFAAANRDPDQLVDPDRLDVCRHNTGAHLAFGAGIHHCIGANLAREEMTQAFHILVRRARNFAFAPGANDFTHHPSIVLRGLQSLHITFEPIA